MCGNYEEETFGDTHTEMPYEDWNDDVTSQGA